MCVKLACYFTAQLLVLSQTLDTDEAYVSTCVPMLMINLLGQHITR